MTETKHEKFRRLMPPRLEKAVYHIGLLENLASHNYEFDVEEARNVKSALDEAVGKVADAFLLNLEGEAPPVAMEPVELFTVLPQEQFEAFVAAVDKPEGEPRTGPIRDEDITAAIQQLVYNQPDKALETLRQALLEEPR